MRISVITVCFNAASVIEGCLASVAEQTFADVEHIVIDGGSSDETVATVKRYPHVAVLVSEPDQGIYDAMNKGLRHVTGNYVLFLNADDHFASATALADAVRAIGRDPGADVYYGSLEIRNTHGEVSVFQPPLPDDAAEFMVCGCLPHQSTLAAPTAFAKTGPFDLRYKRHADYDWFLKVLADPAIAVRRIDTLLGSFLHGGASSQLALGQPEVHAIQDSATLYASPAWDRRRIAILQDALLSARIDTERLSANLREVDALRDLLYGADRGRPFLSSLRLLSKALRLFVSGVLGLPRRVARKLFRAACWVLSIVLPASTVERLRGVYRGWRGR